MLGAGQLVSAVWKTADQRGGRSFRFNIYRTNPRSGRVSQLLQSGDAQDLVNLTQVLAVAMSDDDYLPADQRHALADLAERLGEITNTGS
jgi:hypothetical protein